VDQPGGEALALLAQSAGQAQLELHLASSDGGWGPVASSLSTDDLQSPYNLNGLASFATRRGGSSDQLVGFGTAGPPAGCTSFSQNVWTASATGGTLTAVTSLPLELGCWPVPNPPVATDLNGDGLTDLVLSDTGDLYLLWGASGGAFTLGALFPGPFETTTGEVSAGAVPIGAFAVGDVDGDGLPDLIYERTDSEQLVTVLNAGDGGFW
jgi:hypothetical protein